MIIMISCSQCMCISFFVRVSSLVNQKKICTQCLLDMEKTLIRGSNKYMRALLQHEERSLALAFVEHQPALYDTLIGMVEHLQGLI